MCVCVCSSIYYMSECPQKKCYGKTARHNKTTNFITWIVTRACARVFSLSLPLPPLLSHCNKFGLFLYTLHIWTHCSCCWLAASNNISFPCKKLVCASASNATRKRRHAGHFAQRRTVREKKNIWLSNTKIGSPPPPPPHTRRSRIYANICKLYVEYAKWYWRNCVQDYARRRRHQVRATQSQPAGNITLTQ